MRRRRWRSFSRLAGEKELAVKPLRVIVIHTQGEVSLCIWEGEKGDGCAPESFLHMRACEIVFMHTYVTI